MSFSTVRMPRNTFYGQGAFGEVGKEAKRLGSKVLIISDHIMEKIGYVEECKRYLERENITYAAYLDIHSEPTDQFVLESLALFKEENCDVIIALGGGSCIDTAKAVAVLATNQGDISEYMGNKRLAEQPAAPLIAIPTTAGTGSEATDVTVITNTKNDVKMMIKQPAFLPETAIVDPVLTVSSPKAITAATGVDALTHAIEAYISKRAQPFTDTLALTAIKSIIENIRQVYHSGDDLEARGRMSLAAMQAGVAFSNASVCLVHGMSRPIGAMFHVPHGVSNAMLLPAVLEFSKGMCAKRLAEIAHYVYGEMEGVSKEEAGDRLVAEVKQLCFDLEIPNMKDWGIDQDKLEEFIEKMADDAIISGSPANNPRVPSKQEIIDLYRICYDYQFISQVVKQ